MSGQYDVAQSRGRHLLKAGALVEHYLDDELNPTFSLGIYRFANLSNFLRNVPASFVGLTPQGDFTRHWDWTLYGFYAQDDFAVSPRLTLNLGLRVEGTTMPRDREDRDINMPDLLRGRANRRTALREPGAVVVSSSRRRLGSARRRPHCRCAAATGSTSTPTISRT